MARRFFSRASTSRHGAHRLQRQATSLAGANPREVEDRRWVESRRTDDGMVSIQVRLLPDEAARVLRAIEQCAGGGTLADGAVALANTALLGSASPDGPVRPPVEVIVHVSADSLEGHTEAGDRIPAETCRRLLCDAGVVPLTEDSAGKTIDVGRKSRTIPAALRRALHVRDSGCRWPGCSNVRFVDAHHVTHWIDGGASNLTNVLELCRRNHGYVHEFGFSITVRDGEHVFFDPDGREIPSVAARPPLTRDSLD